MNIPKEFSRILFDEGQQLDGENVFYALSRLRSTRVNYPLRAYVTLNPDPSSWIMPFVRHCLDENMIPIKQDKYPERYFVRNSAGLHFYDTREEAERCHPVDPNDRQVESPVKSYLFQPATITDNPKGLEQNKDYISTLKALPLNEMRQLLYGAWTIASKSGYFKRDWISFSSGYNTETNRRVRAWDLAFSEPSEARPSVDATAGVLMSKDTRTSHYTVEDVVIIRKRVHDVESKIFDTAKQDGKDVIISLPLDPGASGSAYCRNLARRLSEMGYTTKLVRPEKGKLQRFLPFASTAEAGFVKIVNSSWTEDYINELEQTEFNNKTHDDQCDATSDAFYVLNKYQALPDLLPSSFEPSFSSPTAGHSQMFSDLNPNSYNNSVLPSYSFPSFSK